MANARYEQKKRRINTVNTVELRERILINICYG
jgi:hypothetical protein